jgi:D-arabinose 1-dehydrogenase-like Zn-dependent alcohol dehydrogenase
MGTRDELGDLLQFCEQAGIKPSIGKETSMDSAPEAFEAMLGGETAGKIVLTR